MKLLMSKPCAHVVELTDEEFDSLPKFLMQQDIPGEEGKRRQFVEMLGRHLDIMQKTLGLKTMVRNGVMRTFWTKKLVEEAAGSFYNHDGSLMTFDQWKSHVLETLILHPRLAHRYLKFQNVALTGIKHLAEVLEKYNPDEVRSNNV